MNFSQQTGFLVFRIALPLLVFTIQYVLFRRARKWCKERFPNKLWVFRTTIVLFIVFNVAFLFASLLRPRLAQLPEWVLYVGPYPFFIWHGATFFVGLVVLILSLIKLPFWIGLWVSRRIPASREKLQKVQATTSFQEFDTSRRIFLRRSMYGLSAISFAGSSYGVLLGKTSHELTTAEFAIPNLHPDLDGFTIGLISDVHSSAFMTKREMDEYVVLVNSMQTDLIVVPGDFVNSFVEEVYPFAESFSALKAPCGVYGVMGNHDFYTNDPEQVAKEVNDCGVNLLRNDKVTIEKNSGRFYLVGVDDVGRSTQAEAKIDIALGSALPAIPRILLCHRPYFLPQAAERNIDLMLSGHTHGGQIVLGRFGDTVIAPASIASRYIWGKYKIADTHMYVSRGIGTVGLPIRINCPPEITKITLKRESPAT